MSSGYECDTGPRPAPLLELSLWHNYVWARSRASRASGRALFFGSVRDYSLHLVICPDREAAGSVRSDCARRDRSVRQLTQRMSTSSAPVAFSAPFPILLARNRPPVREAGLLEHQLTGFQMMTFFIASSPGAGATLP